MMFSGRQESIRLQTTLNVFLPDTGKMRFIFDVKKFSNPYIKFQYP